MLSQALRLAALAGVAALLTSGPAPAQDAGAKPVVVIDTSAGPITVELDPARAPISVENFLKYVDKGFYDGTIFHRVMPSFMIQGGGMNEANNRLQEKKEGAFPPIRNEGTNGLINDRGTIAMARLPSRNSATSQFYINLKHNEQLDGDYAVFGKVIAGMDVVDAIAKVETTTKADARTGQPHEAVPVKLVTIKSIKRKVKS